MTKIMSEYWVFIRKKMCLIKNKVVKYYNMLGIPIIVNWIFPCSVQNDPNNRCVYLINDFLLCVGMFENREQPFWVNYPNESINRDSNKWRLLCKVICNYPVIIPNRLSNAIKYLLSN